MQPVCLIALTSPLVICALGLLPACAQCSLCVHRLRSVAAVSNLPRALWSTSDKGAILFGSNDCEACQLYNSGDSWCIQHIHSSHAEIRFGSRLAAGGSPARCGLRRTHPFAGGDCMSVMHRTTHKVLAPCWMERAAAGTVTSCQLTSGFFAAKKSHQPPLSPATRLNQSPPVIAHFTARPVGPSSLWESADAAKTTP